MIFIKKGIIIIYLLFIEISFLIGSVDSTFISLKELLGNNFILDSENYIFYYSVVRKHKDNSEVRIYRTSKYSQKVTIINKYDKNQIRFTEHKICSMKIITEILFKRLCKCLNPNTENNHVFKFYQEFLYPFNSEINQTDKDNS